MACVSQGGGGDEIVVDRLLEKRVVLPERMVDRGEVTSEQAVLARFTELGSGDAALVDADERHG